MLEKFLVFPFIFGFVGLPIFTAAVIEIWRPVPEGGELRHSLATRVVGTVAATFLCLWTVVGLVFLPYILWRIWRERRRVARPLADRVGWTVTWLGVALTVSTAVFFAIQEGDGDWRTWETIQRQSRIFLTVSLTPLAGPLTAFILNRREARKSVEPLEAPIDDGDFDFE